MDAAPVPAAAPASVTFDDGLGERHQVVDRPRNELFEILCLRPALTAVPSFEFALRERVSHLATFRQGCYARVRSVERLKAPTSSLALVSDATIGVRLSQLLTFAERQQVTLDIDAALCLLRQLVPAVAMLHEHAPDIAHGAIAAERVIVTPAARIVVVEHVLGSALGELKFSSDRYWKELRVALPSSSTGAKFDHRSDVMQIAAIAVALILGRPLADDEVPSRLGDVVASSWANSARGGLEPLPAGLRSWLMRALQLDPKHRFESAVDAQEELERVLGESDYLAAPTTLEAFLAQYHKAQESGVQTPVAKEPAASTLKPAEPAVAPAVASPKLAEARPAAVTHVPATLPPLSGQIPAANSAPAVKPAESKPAPAAKPFDSGSVVLPPKPHDSGSVLLGAKPVDTPPVALPKPAEQTPIARAAKPSDSGSVVLPPKPHDSGSAPVVKPYDLGSELLAAKPVDVEPAAHAYKPLETKTASHKPLDSPAAQAHKPFDLQPSVLSYKPFDSESFKPVDVPAAAAPEAHKRAWWPAAAAAAVLVVIAGAGVPVVRSYMAPAPAPAEGSLTMTTTPPGAQLFVDGVERGVTPVTVTLKPGTHSLEVRGGGTPRLLPITIAAGAQMSQYLELPTVASAFGQLQVATQPSGARVSVDGVPRGTTPVTVPDLAAGDHTVALESDMGSVKQTVRIEAGNTSSLVVPLGAAEGAPVSGWIAVTAPNDVQLFENGRLLGTSQSDRLMIGAGRHEIEIVNEVLGFRASRTVQVAAGKVSAIKIEFPKGTIALNATPWAEVWADGERVGETPIGTLQLSIGPHEFVFRHPELGEQRHAATVTLKTPARLSVDMRKK